MGTIVKFPGRGTKPITDLSGRRFGRLTVLWPICYTRSNQIRWLCQCSCGNFSFPTRGELIQVHTRSCGCLEIENRRTVHLVHGHSSQANGMTPELRAYFHAKERCENPNVKNYPLYGGRGIKFRFKSAKQFLDHMGPRPSAKHSLDRFPDNNGDYRPGNVRWATSHQQRTNQRPMRHGFKRSEKARENIRKGRLKYWADRKRKAS